MDNWSVVIALGGMVAITIAALLILDGVYQQLAFAYWRHYKASLDAAQACAAFKIDQANRIIAQMQLHIDALKSSNAVLLAMNERLRQEQDVSEADEILEMIER